MESNEKAKENEYNFKKKYSKSLKVYLIVVLVLLIILVGPLIMAALSGGSLVMSLQIFSPLIPIDNIMVAFLVIALVIWPLGSLIGYFIGGKLFTPLFLFFHKRTSGKDESYSIHTTEPPQDFNFFKLSLMPSLLAFNIAFLLADISFISNLVLTPEFITENIAGSSTTLITAIFVLSMFTVVIATAIYNSIYSLREAGVLYTYKKKPASQGYAPELKSIGGTYHTIIKAWAGFSLSIGFIQLSSFELLNILNRVGAEEGVGGSILLLVVVIILLMLVLFCGTPFFIAYMCIPGIIVLDKRRQSRIQFTSKIAKKMLLKEETEN